MQYPEPALVQVFVAELAVEALDVSVLHGPAKLDPDVANAMRLWVVANQRCPIHGGGLVAQ